MTTRGPLVASFITLALPGLARQSTLRTAPAEDAITIEGCLQTAVRERSERTQTPAGGASGMANNTETPRLFVLTDARRVQFGSTIGTAGLATTRKCGRLGDAGGSAPRAEDLRARAAR